MSRVLVVGGGIAGLTCAWRLREAGVEAVVLEAGARAGGAIRTERDGDWVIEAGPCAVLDRTGSFSRLAGDLGLRADLIAASDAMRRRFVRHGDRLHPYPTTAWGLLCSGLLGPAAKVRLLAEPFVRPPPDGGDSSVAEFARRRVGAEAAARLLDPIVSGIYAGDPARLSAVATLPQLVAVERGGKSVLRALWAGARTPDRAPPSMWSFRQGLGTLVESLAVSLGECVSVDSPVEALERGPRGWSVAVGGPRPRGVAAQAIVLAVPAPVARRLLAPLDSGAATALAGIPGAPLAVVSLGWRESDVPRALDGYGYLVPSDEPGPVLGVQWTSCMFPGARSPAGYVQMQVFVGGSRAPDAIALPDDDVVRIATTETRTVLGVSQPPVRARIFRHIHGLPQYEVGHLARAESVRTSLARLPGLHLVGNALGGVGIDACIDGGERTAAAIVGASEPALRAQEPAEVA